MTIVSLACSHEGFHGAYSAFNRFRGAVCKAMGGSFPPHESDFHEDGDRLEGGFWYWGTGFDEKTHPGLYELLAHSDCDGEIPLEKCLQVANDLDILLPKIDTFGCGEGHIFRAGGYGEVTRKFINGCRLAYECNESIYFE